MKLNLGRWAPQAMERSLPLDFASWSTLKCARIGVTITTAKLPGCSRANEMKHSYPS